MISNKKGKTYEEIYGIKKGKWMRKIRSGKNNPICKLSKKERIETNKNLSKVIKKKQKDGTYINPMYGKKHSEKTKNKISKAREGKYCKENHPNWQGGKSFEPYGLEFDKTLKEQIRKRDQYRCQECFRHQDELRTLKTNRKYKLMIHHIDYDKKNNDENNLISLCRPCHMQSNYNRNDWKAYYESKII